MKNNKSIPCLFLISILCLFFYGCKKDTDANTNAVQSYYTAPYPAVDGTVLFQSQINNDPAIKKTVSVNCIYYDKRSNSINDGGTIEVGPYQFLPDTVSGQYNAGPLSSDSLFGVNLAFSLTPPPNTAAPVITSFYSPKAIYITNNTAVPAILDIRSGNSFPITWNTDTKNSNGVNITAKYIPFASFFDSLYSAGYTTEIDNSIMVPDNGNATLPAGFFSKFPIGATLRLFVGRGNCMIVQSGDYKYKLCGFINAMEEVQLTR